MLKQVQQDGSFKHTVILNLFQDLSPRIITKEMLKHVQQDVLFSVPSS